MGGVAFEKAAHTASHSARTPPERHAPASARAANDREPRSPLRAYWSVYELTHPSAGLAAGRGFEKHSHGIPPNLLAHYFSVAGVIEPTLRQAEIERARRKRPDSLDAYDLYLRALSFAYTSMPEDADKALRLLEQASGILRMTASP